MPRRKRLDDDLKQDLSGKQLGVLLAKAHLPKDYPKLTPKRQQEARLHTLQSWFDIKQPHVLCTSTENYLAAHFLWVEFYLKPDPINQGVYFFDDPLDKYDMMNLVMSPAKVESEPTKSVVTATRRKGKTQTIIVEAMTMIPVVRPFSCCLLTQINDRRTKEELGKIKYQIEENDRIHRDFGGPGVLFPKSRNATKAWEKHHIQFLHYPGCEVLGHSLGSSQRGRGPIYGVVDDPEDEKNTYNRDFRREFFDRLLRVYVRMFTFGGKICWVGTPIHEASCLALAMGGKSESGVEDDDRPANDQRLIDWHRGRFSLIVKKDGSYVSMQPQRMTVQAFHKLMEIDPIAATAEILCKPITPGIRAFKFDNRKHGFLHCKGSKEVVSGEVGSFSMGLIEEEYMLDLYTGVIKPWDQFLDELIVFGAGDLADGQSDDCDPGAVVFIGVDPDGVVFVLDAWQGRVFAEKLVRKAYDLAGPWQCSVFGWEKAALQCVINRVIARREVQEMRDQGEAPPVFREIENHKKNKTRRILTMTGLFNKRQIRFRRFDTIRDDEGRVHEPVRYAREGHYRDLLAQMIEFTDEGLRGYVDLIDTLEMAVRLSAHRRGEILNEVKEDPSDRIMEGWRKVGLPMTPQMLPPNHWTPKMRREMGSELEPAGFSMGVVPYV